MVFVGKIVMLTFSDTEEKAVEKAIAALADMIPLEAMQPPHSPALTFPGLEIKLHQRRVLKNGTDIPLTRLEYGALCYLAASPGRVFTKAQIFEAVWSMESESCQSNVSNLSLQFSDDTILIISEAMENAALRFVFLNNPFIVIPFF